MHITLADDSIAFDGYSAASRPLGGAEKAFSSLPGALVRLGHDVAVYNRCRWPMYVEGAQWETLDGRKPLRTDVLVAFRKPELLEFVRHAGRRVLWHTGPGRVLERPQVKARLDEHKPLVVLVSEAQARGWKAGGLAVGLLAPALRFDYLADQPMRPAVPPRAIVTTHPAHGLAWLIDLWVRRIRPAVPGAELHVYSASLARAVETGEIDEALRPLAEQVEAARGDGVVVMRPQGDHIQAEEMRQARLHLYPGHADDCTAFSLMESQAVGLPAVLRPLGAAPERVEDGTSAFVAPDDEAFANCAVLVLADDGVFARMSAAARLRYQTRSWDAAAASFMAMLA